MTPTPAAVWSVRDAFLSPEQASVVEAPGWTVDVTTVAEPGPLFAPCGTRTHPLADQVRDSDERVMSSTRETGGSTLRQEVFRYSSAETAAASLRVYADDAHRCPLTAEGTPDARCNEVVEQGTGLLVRQVPCAPECTDLYASWVMVVHDGDGLSAATYAMGEDGDPVFGARALYKALQEQLDSAVNG